MRSASEMASSKSRSGPSVPSATGTPAAIALRFCSDLSPHQTDGCRSRADKRQTGLRDALAKSGFSDRKPKPGMNGLTAGSQRRRNDIIHIQVAVRRTGRTDADRFVRDLRACSHGQPE